MINMQPTSHCIAKLTKDKRRKQSSQFDENSVVPTTVWWFQKFTPTPTVRIFLEIKLQTRCVRKTVKFTFISKLFREKSFQRNLKLISRYIYLWENVHSAVMCNCNSFSHVFNKNFVKPSFLLKLVKS